MHGSYLTDEQAQGMLACIPCSGVNYDDWLRMGAALYHAGVSLSVWDEWSRSDRRYKREDCAKRWNGFNRNGNTAGAGTVIFLARKYGWHGETHGKTYRAKAPDPVQSLSLEKFPAPAPIEKTDIPLPEQARKYIDALFRPDEYINVVTRYIEEKKGDGTVKLKPCGLGQIETAEAFKAPVNPNKNAGVWVRINPVVEHPKGKNNEGKGVANDDITAFRYALVESDEIPIEQQINIYTRLQLPCAALVYSGGKSVHAVVKIDAENKTEYAERVRELFDICNAAGLKIDENNKNPSRLTRLPGYQRGNDTQKLIALDTGKESWDDWKRFINVQQSMLPDIIDFASIAENLPERKPVLIQNLLRRGHVMELSGASKVGKSFALIDLAVALSVGDFWLNHKCKKSKVLYVNFEIDDASFLRRVADVCKAMDVKSWETKNLCVWNLRGLQLSTDEVAKQLLLMCAADEYGAIILDPIYKFFEGDENSAGDVGRLFSCFDRICRELGCAVIFCHHHSKGSQGGKFAMDRSSGSGVFARSPDCIVDILQLAITDDAKKVAEEYNLDIDDNTVGCEYNFTVREFPPQPSIHGFFMHPLHIYDKHDILKDAPSARDLKAVTNSIKVNQAGYKKVDWQNLLDNSFAAAGGDEEKGVPIDKLLSVLQKSKGTVRNHLAECGYSIRKGYVYLMSTLDEMDRQAAEEALKAAEEAERAAEEAAALAAQTTIPIPAEGAGEQSLPMS